MRIRIDIPDSAIADVLGDALSRQGHTVIGNEQSLAELTIARYPHNMHGSEYGKVITLYGARESREYEEARSEAWNQHEWAILCPFKFDELIEAILWLTLSREYA